MILGGAVGYNGDDTNDSIAGSVNGGENIVLLGLVEAGGVMENTPSLCFHHILLIF